MELDPPWERSKLLDCLREEEGDIVVRLTPNPEEWLVLKRSEVAKGSEMLISLLKPKWDSRPVTMAHPVTGVESEMWILSLIWTGETFALTGRDSEEPLADFPPPSSPMSPKFPVHQYTMYRDSLEEDIHPGLLATHDLFIMFALMYSLPVTFAHLPFHQHTDPADVMRLGAERFASVITHVEYYCSLSSLSSRTMILKDLLFEYLFTHAARMFIDTPDGPWLALLRLSGELQFPELYIFIILEACEYELDRPQLEELADVLSLDSPEEAGALLDKARAEFLPIHRDQLGMIVHIPFMGLNDYRVLPINSPNLPIEDLLTNNSGILSGSIWEAHMRIWAYWRGLTYCAHQQNFRGQRLKWKQRFARYGVSERIPRIGESSHVLPAVEKRIVDDSTPLEMLQAGETTHSAEYSRSLTFFTTTLRPIILHHAREGTEEPLGVIFHTSIIDHFIDLAWERDRGSRDLAIVRTAMQQADAVDMNVSAHLDDPDHRRMFVERARLYLRWYMNEAAAIFRSSLRPPGGVWDLGFCGGEFTWADEGFTAGVDLQEYLDDEETGVVGGGPPPGL